MIERVVLYLLRNPGNSVGEATSRVGQVTATQLLASVPRPQVRQRRRLLPGRAVVGGVRVPRGRVGRVGAARPPRALRGQAGGGAAAGRAGGTGGTRLAAR